MSACAYGQDPGTTEPADEVPSEIAQPLDEQVNKICSYLVPNKWRDSLVAPGWWSKSTCSRFGQKVGATHYQTGCMNNTSIDMSDIVSVVDSPRNIGCGW